MQLRKKDFPGLYIHTMDKLDVTYNQARAIMDNLGWGFHWQKHEDLVIFSSKPENKKQLEMFRESISKYAGASSEVMEASTGQFMFAVLTKK